jgi:hypothetical protein
MIIINYKLKTLKYTQTLMHSYTMYYKSMWIQQIIWKSVWSNNI